MTAGKMYEDVIVVKNTEKRPLEVKLRLEDWFKAVEGKETKKKDMFEWLKLEPSELTLKEGETGEVKYKVMAPKKARGELNAMIFVEAKPKELPQASIGINTSIGVPLYAMIKGTEKFKAEIKDLKIVKTSPLELAITIENSGNVHIRPTGSIEIINTDVIVPLNEYNYPVLPNTSRTLEIRSDDRLEKGKYMADIKMGYGDKRYRKKIKIQNERG
ncbi:MAG: hypothetical protein PHO42_02040 [Candidatus Omnitrophica bacterium]|nr:hypothetical protein [Candidatus Omnitrophota bacterium]